MEWTFAYTSGSRNACFGLPLRDRPSHCFCSHCSSSSLASAPLTFHPCLRPSVAALLVSPVTLVVDIFKIPQPCLIPTCSLRWDLVILNTWTELYGLSSWFPAEPHFLPPVFILSSQASVWLSESVAKVERYWIFCTAGSVPGHKEGSEKRVGPLEGLCWLPLPRIQSDSLACLELFVF